eukprot:jgi/Picre1/35687/NNA_003148.t1
MDAPEKANKKLRPVAPSFTPSKLTSATGQNEKVEDVQAGGEGEKEMVDTQETKAKDERPTEAPLEAQHPVLGEEQQQDEKVLEEPEATVIPQVENAGETDVHAAEDKSLINEEVNAEVEKKPAEEEEKPAEEEKKPAEEEEKKPAEEDDQKPESPKKPKQAKKRTKILWKDSSKQ